MKHFNFHAVVISLVIVAMLGMAAVACAPAKPAAPAVPAAPSTPVAPATPAAPTTPSTTPAAQTITPPAVGPLPTVNHFSSSSDSLPPDSLAILVWSVSGADSVSIDNGVGKVEAHGRCAVLPYATTTFVLTAANAAGSMTAQVTVEVSELRASSSGFHPGYSMARIQQTAVLSSPLTIKQDTVNASGKRWVVDYYDPSMLSYLGSNYIEMNPLTRGVDGQQQFTFQPLKQGITKIVVSNVNEQTPLQFESVIYDVNIRH
jgi:hypothetical protein